MLIWSVSGMAFDLVFKMIIGCIEEFADFGMRWESSCMKIS